MFESLLEGLGFQSLLEKRLTPRLVFYVLGRKRPSVKSSTTLAQPTDDDKADSKPVAVGDDGKKKVCHVRRQSRVY
jgi:hypothetical protein